MPGPQQMAPSGLRPPQGTFPGSAGQMHFNQQKASVPSMENSHANQLSNGEQTSSDSVQEAAETEQKVNVISTLFNIQQNFIWCNINFTCFLIFEFSWSGFS